MRRGPNFTLRDRGVNARLASCLNSVLNVKVVEAAFNQEKALVGAFFVITNLRMELFEALLVTGLRDTAHVSRAVGPLCDVSLGSSHLQPDTSINSSLYLFVFGILYLYQLCHR